MDLRQYIDQLREIGELLQVDGADWDLEIGSITELAAEKDGPALLFDRVKGYPAGRRILTNFLNHPGQIGAIFGSAPDLLSLVRSVKERFARLQPIPPRLTRPSRAAIGSRRSPDQKNL